MSEMSAWRGGENATPSFRDLVPNFTSVQGWLDLPEAEELFRAAARARSGCIVEVGSYHGRSTLALCAGSSVGAQLPVYAIEPHEEAVGVLGGKFGPQDRAAFFRNFSRTPLVRHVRLINSTSSVVAKGWGKPVSLLFIDGDHHYKAVHADFASWEPHLARGATVVFDDPDLPGPEMEIKALVAAGALNFVRRVGNLAVLEFTGRRAAADAGAVGRSSGIAKAARRANDGYAVPWRDVGRHIYYGGNGTYLYQPIPKCACTTVKTLLLEFEGLPIDDDLWRRHQKELNKFPGTDHLPDAEQRSIFEGRTDTFKFVIVRNPYGRLTSVYCDKIVLQPDPYVVRQITAAARRHGIALSDPIGFGEFVSVVTRQSPGEMDPHWRPQFYEGRFGIVGYDFIGRMEMMPNDLIYILERIGAPRSIIAGATRKLNETGSDIEPWKSVPAEVRDRFLDAFAIDFETLPYPRALPGEI